MIRITNSKSNGTVGRKGVILVIISLLLQVAVCFQGIDLTDEGFWASFYQSIFISPATVKYGFMYWLTGVVGGVWMKAFHGLGLLGLRLLSVICQILTMVLAWYILRPFIRRESMGWGFLASVLLIHNNILSFYANPFSVMLLIASFACAWGFIRKKRLFWIMLSGGLIGIAFFARIPNIVGVVGVTIPLLESLLKRQWSWRSAGLWSACYFIGLAGGFVVMVCIMAVLGHIPIFLDVLRLLAEMGAGSGEQAHHSFGALFMHQLRVYGFTSIVSIVGCVGIGLGSWLLARMSKSMLPCTVYQFAVASMVIMIVCLSYFLIRYSAMCFVYYLALAIGFSMAFYESVILRVSSDRVTAWWSALLVAAVLPVGSNAPHFIGRYALWLLLPLSMDCISNLRWAKEWGATASLPLPRISGCWPRLFTKAAMVSLLIASAVLTWQQCYRDSRNRIRLNTPINSKQTRGLLTTQERVIALTDLLNHLQVCVKPGDHLLAYADMPMVHFLTDTRPALENAWPKLYTPEVFGAKLDALAKGSKRFPPVLRQRTNLGVREWPTERIDYLEAPSNKARTDLLDQFLRSNGYVCQWQTENFDFWTSPGHAD